MHRATNIDRAVAIPCQICWFDESCCNARTKELTVPGAMISVRDLAGILAAQDFLHAPPDSAKCLPVPACRKCVALIPVSLHFLRIPVSRAHPLNQFRVDPVT